MVWWFMIGWLTTGGGHLTDGNGAREGRQQAVGQKKIENNRKNRGPPPNFEFLRSLAVHRWPWPSKKEGRKVGVMLHRYGTTNSSVGRRKRRRDGLIEQRKNRVLAFYRISNKLDGWQGCVIPWEGGKGREEGGPGLISNFGEVSGEDLSRQRLGCRWLQWENPRERRGKNWCSL